jgi:hypothetical protein
MRKILKYICSLFLITVAVAYLLDFVFTTIYINSKPRNKIALAYGGKVEDYDVIFLGSSRTNNHFVAQEFIDHGYKSYNYGMSGSRLEESALLLNLLLEKGTKIKNVVLEVDLNINSNGFSDGTRAFFYPYLTNSKTISNYYSNVPEYNQFYYVPFYRYLKYDAKIGFRELFFTAIEKPSRVLQFNGFYALTNTGKEMSFDLSGYTPKKNFGYEKIKELCKKYNVNLISVTTPMCENTKNIAYFDAVVKLYPEIHNLENVVKEDQYFSSCGHMNEKGAKLFTLYVMNKFFK